MTSHRRHLAHERVRALVALVVALTASALFTPALHAAELPAERPLWPKPPTDYPNTGKIKEKVRSHKSPGSPSGLNRAFSSVSAFRPPRTASIGRRSRTAWAW